MMLLSKDVNFLDFGIEVAAMGWTQGLMKPKVGPNTMCISVSLSMLWGKIKYF